MINTILALLIAFLTMLLIGLSPAFRNPPPDPMLTGDGDDGTTKDWGPASPTTVPSSMADARPSGLSPLGHAPIDAEAALRAAERGWAAAQSLDYPWQERLPGWDIHFHPSTGGAYGFTHTRDRRIDIYVRPDQSDSLLVHVVAHEIGHALDVTYNDGDDRQRWQKARAIEHAPWWPDNRAPDFATGAGDFAESFAAWQVGSRAFRSELAPPPTAEQLDLLAELTRG